MMSETVKAIAILTHYIANLSVERSPPHETIRALQKNLDKLIDKVKEQRP